MTCFANRHSLTVLSELAWSASTISWKVVACFVDSCPDSVEPRWWSLYKIYIKYHIFQVGRENVVLPLWNTQFKRRLDDSAAGWWLHACHTTPTARNDVLNINHTWRDTSKATANITGILLIKSRLVSEVKTVMYQLNILRYWIIFTRSLNNAFSLQTPIVISASQPDKTDVHSNSVCTLNESFMPAYYVMVIETQRVRHGLRPLTISYRKKVPSP